MKRGILYLANALGLVGLLAACEPTWDSRVPVQHGADGPVRAQRPATVTVYAGDSIYSIARRYSLSVRDLIDANSLQPPYQLAPGTVLRLPGGGSEYVVQKGDTLSVLARRFKVDFNSLAATNSKKPPYVLHVGERLTLPGGAAKAPVIVASPNAGSARPEPPAVVPAPGQPQPQPQPQTQTETAMSPPPVAPPPGSVADAVVPPPPARAAGGFLWPVKGEMLNEFGPMAGKGQHNDGINIAAPRGTPVRAAENGVVAYVGNELKGFGNLLLVKHSDGWITAYAHNERLMVKRGDKVRRGQTIATVGSSGSVTSPQLHFEIRHGTEAVNPTDYLRDSVASAQ